MNTTVHFSSETDLWSTPQWFFDELDDEFNFTLDPCSTDQNHKCNNYYTLEDDGLSKTWYGHTVFMNPPYGREIGKWMQKASSELNCTVVCLVPSRTDTRWWHEYVIDENAEVRFIKGRLKFGNAKNSAPFPSAVVIYRTNRKRKGI